MNYVIMQIYFPITSSFLGPSIYVMLCYVNIV